MSFVGKNDWNEEQPSLSAEDARARDEMRDAAEARAVAAEQAAAEEAVKTGLTALAVSAQEALNAQAERDALRAEVERLRAENTRMGMSLSHIANPQSEEPLPYPYVQRVAADTLAQCAEASAVCENQSLVDRGQIKVTKVTLLITYGPDVAILDTELPDGCWPYTGLATARIDVAKGKGEEWCKANLPGVPLEIIDTTGKQTSAIPKPGD